MLDTPTLNLLTRALDYSSTRETVLSNNIANINTPGYKRKDASFADVLAESEGGAAADISHLRARGRQLFGQDGQNGSVEVIQSGGGAMRLDGNNIDMDSEMSSLAQNQVYYQALTQLTSSQFSGLKYVISGGSGSA